MAPSETTTILQRNPEIVQEQQEETLIKPAQEKEPYFGTFFGTAPSYPWKFSWFRGTLYIYAHLTAIYGLIHIINFKWQCTLFAVITGVLSGLGVTAGSHRYWSHRSFKAKWPLRFILFFLHTLSAQFTIFEWAKIHRNHHKFVETDGDPHNAKRGFFYAHIGWILVHRHEDTEKKFKIVDLSDLENDPLVMFQYRHRHTFRPLLAFVLPTIAVMYFFNECFVYAWTSTILRYTIAMNVTSLLNSVAHLWGNRPFDQYQGATDGWQWNHIALGEGAHNYHHVFPWDYRTNEFGCYEFNLTTNFIDLFVKLGWAYDLKTVSTRVLRQRALRTGDGSYNFEEAHKKNLWGWGDTDIQKEDSEATLIIPNDNSYKNKKIW